MKRALFALLALVIFTLCACGESASKAPAPTATRLPTAHYTAILSALNGSGVSGTADFQLTSNGLVAVIQATGLVPNQKHFQHLHGGVSGNATCPTAADAHANGGVTLTEALAKIGNIAFDLQPYPVADGQGAVNESQTFILDPNEVANITPMTGLVLVLHGGMNQRVYDRFLLVACGPVVAA
jgi:hypothetical protein